MKMKERNFLNVWVSTNIPDVVQTIYHLDLVYGLKPALRIQKTDVLSDKDRCIYGVQTS